MCYILQSKAFCSKMYTSILKKNAEKRFRLNPAYDFNTFSLQSCIISSNFFLLCQENAIAKNICLFGTAK